MSLNPPGEFFSCLRVKDTTMQIYNKKYMIGSTQIEIRNAEIFASKPVLIFKFNSKNYR